MAISDEQAKGHAGEDAPDHPLSLFVVALVAGVYAMVPGFYLDGLRVKPGAEIVDHVVPGLVVLALVAAAARWGNGTPALMLFAGVGILLCGFWITDVHLPLIRQASHGLAPKGATIYHFSTAVVLDIVGAAWLWRFRHAGSAATPQG